MQVCPFVLQWERTLCTVVSRITVSISLRFALFLLVFFPSHFVSVQSHSFLFMTSGRKHSRFPLYFCSTPNTNNNNNNKDSLSDWNETMMANDRHSPGTGTEMNRTLSGEKMCCAPDSLNEWILYSHNNVGGICWNARTPCHVLQWTRPNHFPCSPNLSGI